jgi:hypothetical protein
MEKKHITGQYVGCPVRCACAMCYVLVRCLALQFCCLLCCAMSSSRKCGYCHIRVYEIVHVVHFSYIGWDTAMPYICCNYS